jgi:hypothetical protein
VGEAFVAAVVSMEKLGPRPTSSTVLQRSSNPKALILSNICDKAILQKHSLPIFVDNPEFERDILVSLTWRYKQRQSLRLALGSPLLSDSSFFDGCPLEFRSIWPGLHRWT